MMSGVLDRVLNSLATGVDRRAVIASLGRVVILYFLVVFFGTLLVDVVFRSFVLPVLFPGLHAGNGFMVGGDAMGFHEKAVDIAARIRSIGWSEWQLRPNATLDTPAGIASAIYAVLGFNPLVLMPFNALVHAGAATCLFLILRPIIGGNSRHAIVATLPFVMFPTAFYWHSQLHKDGVFILGMYLFLLGWLHSLHGGGNSWRRNLLSWAMLAVAAAIVWAVRAYMLMIFSAVGVALVILAAAFEWRWHKLGKLTTVDWGWRIIWRVAFCFALAHMGGSGKAELTQVRQDIYEATRIQSMAEVGCADCQNQNAWSGECPHWIATPFVPGRVDRLGYSVALTRQGYFQNVYAGAGSTIDKDHCLNSLADILIYSPRAMQIALFAPFPWQWIQTSSQGGGGRVMRLLAGGEMLVVYSAFVFCVAAVWRRRSIARLWAMVTFSIALLLLLATVTPNIGALHRMRYGYLMLLVGLGVGYMHCLFSEHRRGTGAIQR